MVQSKEQRKKTSKHITSLHRQNFQDRLVVTAEVEDGSQLLKQALVANNIVDGSGVHGRAELVAVVKNLDVDVVVHHDHGGLDGVVAGAVEVVGRTALVVAVQGGLHALVAGGQDFEDVELAAARGPARALRVAVLEGTGDLRVQHPDGGHVDRVVLADALLAVVGHLEFEEEGLVGAGEAVVRDGAGTAVAARVALAFLVGHDDDLVLGRELAVIENLGGGAAALAVGAGVREGVAEGVVEDAGAGAAVVVQEDEAVGVALAGAVVGLTTPVATGGGATKDAVNDVAARRAGGRRGRGRRRRGGGGRGAGVRASVVGLVLDRGGSGGSVGAGGLLAGVVVGPADGLAVDGGVDHVAEVGVGLTLVGVGVSVGVATGGGATADLVLGGGRVAGGVDGELLQLGGTTDVDGDLGGLLGSIEL